MLVHAGYHVRLRATVTEFLSAGARINYRLRAYLHKSIKSLLVEFERPPSLLVISCATRTGAGEYVRQMFRLEA